MQDVADQSLAPTAIGADLCAIFCLIEPEPIDLAYHIAVARPRREDVQAQRVRQGYRCAAGALFQSRQEKKARARTRKILPNRRHSRSGAGWLLDLTSVILLSEGIESHVVDAASIAISAPAAAGQDRQDRRRGLCFARCSPTSAARTAGLLNGSQGADAGR